MQVGGGAAAATMTFSLNEDIAVVVVGMGREGSPRLQ